MSAVLALITEAADAGAKAPKNAEMAAALGTSRAKVEREIARLRAMGAIATETHPTIKARRITILATGTQTQWSEIPNHGARPTIKRAEEIMDAVEDAARDAIARGAQMPLTSELIETIGCEIRDIDRAIRRLRRAGRIQVESAGGFRRVCVGGGWTANRPSASRDASERRAENRAAKAAEMACDAAARKRDRERNRADIKTAAEVRAHVLDLLSDLAEAGEPLLSQEDMAKRLGVKLDAVDKAFRQLRMAHSIHVESEGTKRRVLVRTTGKATGWLRLTGVAAQPGVDPSLRNPAWVIPADYGGRMDHCQWLHGNATDRNFCGQPTQEGSSYCPEHHKRCWYMPKDNRRRKVV